MVSDTEFKPKFFGDDEEPVQPEPEETEPPQKDESAQETPLDDISDDEYNFIEETKPEEESLSFAEQNLKHKSDQNEG